MARPLPTVFVRHISSIASSSIGADNCFTTLARVESLDTSFARVQDQPLLEDRYTSRLSGMRTVQERYGAFKARLSASIGCSAKTAQQEVHQRVRGQVGSASCTSTSMGSSNLRRWCWLRGASVGRRALPKSMAWHLSRVRSLGAQRDVFLHTVLDRGAVR